MNDIRKQTRFLIWSDNKIQPENPFTRDGLVKFTGANPESVDEWIDLSSGGMDHMSYQTFVEGSITLALEGLPGIGADNTATPGQWINYYQDIIDRWRELNKSTPNTHFTEFGDPTTNSL